MTNVPRGTLKLKPKEYCHGVTSAAPVPHNRATPVEGSVKYSSLKAGWKRRTDVPPWEAIPIGAVANRVMVAVSTCTRTPDVPSLALTTKLVPLVTSTIGGARMPGFVPPLAPITNDLTWPVVMLIEKNVPF